MRVVVGGSAANMNKTFTTGLRPMGNSPTALAGVEMHPLLPPAAASLHGKASHTILSRPRAPYESCSLATPEGEILAALCFEVLMG